MTPREARTWEKICELPSDGVSTRNYAMSIDADCVIFTRRHVGMKPTEEMIISRQAFEKFIDWYNTGKLTEVWKLPRECRGLLPKEPTNDGE